MNTVRRHSPSHAPSSHPPPVYRPLALSLGTKLALATVTVLAIASTLLFLELTGRERRALVAAKTQAASMVVDLFAANVQAPVDFFDTDPESLQSEIDNLKSNPDVTCAQVWSAPSGKLLGQLDRGGCAGLAMPDESDLGAEAVLADRVRLARIVAQPTTHKPFARAVLVLSLAHENEAYATSRKRIFLLSSALATVIALLLIAVARWQIVTPLLRLTHAARRIQRGDLGQPVEVKSRDEIGELARAFDRMRAAVADREQRLEAARQEIRDLFDHMRQAICAFDREGRIVGAASRQAAIVFGRASLQGERVRDLLYAAAGEGDLDAQAFDEWMLMAFDVPLDRWSELADLAPREVTLRRGTRAVPLELEFRPVVKDAGIERVMLLATDVSEKKKLEQTVQTQEEEHARRMAAMRRLIAGGGQVFVQFMEAARERIRRCLDLVGPQPRMVRTGEIDELFRHVHTIKGEARAFDLRDLETETAKLEEELDELRSLARGEGFATTGSVHGALVSRLTRASLAIDKGAEVFVDASPIGKAALDQLTVQRPDVAVLTEIAERRGDDELTRAVARLAARPFGESTASLIDMAPTWGDREGKLVTLDVDGREVRVPPKLARVLQGVLTHLVRNAIAHGIEPPKTREDAHKLPTGTIRVVAAAGGEAGPTIVVEDDGRGLRLDAIAERAARMGVAGVSEKDLVFVAGLSTADRGDDLAGRGVGLGAVRDDLEHVGYTVSVDSAIGKFTRFTMKPR